MDNYLMSLFAGEELTTEQRAEMDEDLKYISDEIKEIEEEEKAEK